LQDAGKDVIAFTNSTNAAMQPPPLLRADSWDDAESMIRDRYYSWRTARSKPLPEQRGYEPPSTTTAGHQT
jgi:hypothetical protein